MLKEVVYSVVGITIVILAYAVLSVPAFVISSAFGNLGAPDNIISLSTTAFSLAFLALIFVIIVFVILRAVKKEFEVRGY